MADVQPLRALHYDRDRVGGLQDRRRPALRRDRRRAARRAARPLAVQRRRDRPPAGRRPLRHTPPRCSSAWRTRAPRARRRARALGARAGLHRPGRAHAAPATGSSRASRVEDYGPGRIRPHERTHPGPKEDRLRLTRATHANLSPIFSLYDDPAGAAWGALEPHLDGEPWAEVTDEDGTDPPAVARHRPRRAIEAVHDALADAELLIADGHHRYETARVYADEIGGEAPRYVLMCLVALQDPGLTVFPTHRLLTGHDAGDREALRATSERDFEIEPIDADELAPTGRRPGRHGLPRRPPQAAAAAHAARTRRSPTRRSPDKPEPYRAARHGGARGARAHGRAGHDARTTSPTCTASTTRAPAQARERVRVRRRPGGVLHARHAGDAGARRRGGRREHAAEVARTSSRRSSPACCSIRWTDGSPEREAAIRAPCAPSPSEREKFTARREGAATTA